ncbi:hypothetical protein [Streptomyces yangpuensis]|uniref:hypothetical protein n=1 Tax=Streptomyces yangpuensis TaxID=1648182 RepID=UPI003658A066
MNDPSAAVKDPRHVIVRSPRESGSPHTHRSALNLPSTPVSWVIRRGTAAWNIQMPTASPMAIGTA